MPEAAKALVCLLVLALSSGTYAVHSGRKMLRGAAMNGTMRRTITSISEPAQLMKTLRQKRTDSKVFMMSHEAAIIESYLTPEDHMLEWGAGASTSWFSQFVGNYYSIEHSREWFKKIEGQIGALSNVHAILSPVADGHKGWGGGAVEGTYEQFKDYVTAVDKFKVPIFSKVLIDGRARSSCAIYILKYLNADSVVFIHDYHWRNYYHQVVKDYYDIVAQTFDGQTLVVLRPKKVALKRVSDKEDNLELILQTLV